MEGVRPRSGDGGIAVIGLLRADWVPLPSIVLVLTIVIGRRMTCASVTIFMPAIARLFLDNLRAGVEVEQHARAMSLDRGMFLTWCRVGVLILISPLEGQADIATDVGIRQRLTNAQSDDVFAQMIPLLVSGQVLGAALTGLGVIAHLLARHA